MSKILLLGDSITAHMPNNLIGNENDEIINAGTENIGIGSCHNYIWPKFKNQEIDVIVLLIGINNILRPDCDYDNMESLKDTVKKMINFINELNTPYVHLIVQSVYPTRNEEVNKKIQIFNDKIFEHCYQLAIEYLDLYDLLLDENGLLMEKYTKDGIHPNFDGYNLIANQINELFLMYDNNYFK